MKRVLVLALICPLACAPFARLQAQAPASGQVQTPGVVTGATVAESPGAIAGTVTSSSGRRLRDLTIQLVNSTGSIVGMTVTSKDGEFRIEPVDRGTYTLQCVADKKVLGTSSVTLAGPSESVKMICAADPGFWKKWGFLTALGAAAATAGTVAIVPGGSVASPSQ